MSDRLYSFLFSKSIKKYDKRTIQNLYMKIFEEYNSNKYSGVYKHRLYLQLQVLRKRMIHYVNQK